MFQICVGCTLCLLAVSEDFMKDPFSPALLASDSSTVAKERLSIDDGNRGCCFVLASYASNYYGDC